MRFLSTLIVFTVMTACTSKPNFEAEMELFYKEANKRGCITYPVDIHFARLGTTAGYCIPKFGILINESLWQDYGPYQRKELVLHELGHCVLQAEHESFGLMTPSMHSEAHLEAVWDTYVDLLFKDCVTLSTIVQSLSEEGGK